MSHITSHGRGGAGNLADSSKEPPMTQADLQTPTIKTPVYTTGRGGSGNMIANKDAEAARAAQDVGPVNPRSSTEAMHVGRGGAANVMRTSQDAKRDGEHKNGEHKQGFISKLLGKKE